MQNLAYKMEKNKSREWESKQKILTPKIIPVKFFPSLCPKALAFRR